MPHVIVKLAAGRSEEQKQALTRKMVEALTSTVVCDEDANMAGRADRAPYDPMRDNVLMLVQPDPEMKEGSFRTFHGCDFWDATGVY